LAAQILVFLPVKYHVLDVELIYIAKIQNFQDLFPMKYLTEKNSRSYEKFSVKDVL